MFLTQTIRLQEILTSDLAELLHGVNVSLSLFFGHAIAGLFKMALLAFTILSIGQHKLPQEKESAMSGRRGVSELMF